MPVSILIYYLAIASSMRPPDDILMDNAPFTTPPNQEYCYTSRKCYKCCCDLYC